MPELISEATPEERLGKVESDLLARGAAAIAYGRWSLYQHLANTGNVLEQWGEPIRVELAGSLLAAYRPDVASRLSEPFAREYLEEIIGNDAEQLVKLSSIDVHSDSLSTTDMSQSRVFPIVRDPGAALSLDVSPNQARDLFVALCASCANEGEEDGTPARWLAVVSEAADAACGRGFQLPPVLEACATAKVSSATENSLCDAYRWLAENLVAHPNEAVDLLQYAVEQVDLVGEPLVLLGLCALAGRDITSAAEFGTRARTRLTAWCTSWDKRLSILHWLALAQFLERSPFCNEAELQLLVTQLHRILDSSGGRIESVYTQLEALELLGTPTVEPPIADILDDDALTDVEGYSDFDLLPARFSQYIAGFRDNASRPLMGIYPGLTARPWWDSLEFDVCKQLRRHANEIIAEFRAIDDNLFQSVDDGSGDPKSVFPLVSSGVRVAHNWTLCPVTARLLAESASAFALGGDIYFELVPPQAERPLRSDYTNIRLRCFLALTGVDGVELTVDGLPERPREGRLLVFDPSFLHRELNRGPRNHGRLVLDLAHPDLTSDERELFEGLNRLVGATAGRLHRHQFVLGSFLRDGESLKNHSASMA